jgi:DNA-binding LacI/PurR family transcriptional regulator
LGNPVRGKDRRKGWARALKQVGLELGPCLEGDWSAESAFAAAVKLLEREPRDFTAIVAANDHMALSLLRALFAKGMRVPEQISVDDYDDLLELRYFEPALTMKIGANVATIPPIINVNCMVDF